MAIQNRIGWKLAFKSRWPFGFAITNSDGDIVVSQQSVCASSVQQTRDENIAAKGYHQSEQDSVRAAVAAQDRNAKLFLAAPDLLQAAKLALESMSAVGGQSPEVIAALGSAIALAEAADDPEWGDWQ